MINCKDFFILLKKYNIDFYAGVPDSLLKNFNVYVMDHTKHHIITANEGAAIALATGYHLATKKIGLVYMQNSGLGNAVNPLISLVDPEVYSIPMLLLIGWRGQPGIKDEPQHTKQGKITLGLLDTLGISYEILPKNSNKLKGVMEKANANMTTKNAPFALVVQKNTFEPYILKTENTNYQLTREEALKLIIDNLEKEDIVVSTTGKTSRELFEYREELKQGHNKDFLTVGSMGHSSQIALGIAMSKPERNIYCLDGDGSVIMHMGSLAIIGTQKPENFKHIILNNGAHESVGGQPTAGFNIDFCEIAKASGYTMGLTTSTKQELLDKFEKLKNSKGPAMLEIKIKPGSRKDLARPNLTPQELKKMFMDFVSNNIKNK